MEHGVRLLADDRNLVGFENVKRRAYQAGPALAEPGGLSFIEKPSSR
jgi:hypothetical protein